jgi:hypothetical protein
MIGVGCVSSGTVAVKVSIDAGSPLSGVFAVMFNTLLVKTSTWDPVLPPLLLLPDESEPPPQALNIDSKADKNKIFFMFSSV